MSPLIIAVSPHEPREDRVRRAAETLRGGGVAALPTETFYGLAADAFHREAVGRLNRLKGKAEDEPILLLLADVSQVPLVARDLPGAFSKMAGVFWPGHLTLVVPAAEDLPREVTGGRGTVGIRVPGLALPRRVAEMLGRPVTGVSANLHREPPCRTAQEVVRAFEQGVDLVLDGGPATGGAPSTILDLTGPRPRVLRHGIVPDQALAVFLPDLELR